MEIFDIKCGSTASGGRVLTTKLTRHARVACDCFVAPAVPKFTNGFSCKCRKYASSHVDGHLRTRKWGRRQTMPGAPSFTCQPVQYCLYPLSNAKCCWLTGASRQCKAPMAGMNRDASSEITAAESTLRYGQATTETFPAVWHGFWSEIDRNPGRVVLMCTSLWLSMQMNIFLNNTRYQLEDIPLCSEGSSCSCNNTSHFCSVSKRVWRGC